MPPKVRIACESDSQEISALVNRAYRPPLHKAGWTHESNLVAGERICAEQVRALFNEQSTILLLFVGSEIVACVHVKVDMPGAYIGMLATDPSMQNQGIGKQMMHLAEAYAMENYGATLLKISVLSSRSELLAFYERLGYVRTGEEEGYPLSAGVGQPMIPDLKVLFLAKAPANPAFQRTACGGR